MAVTFVNGMHLRTYLNFDHALKLCQGLFSMQKKGDLCDASIVYHGNGTRLLLPVHRNVLCVYSDYIFEGAKCVDKIAQETGCKVASTSALEIAVPPGVTYDSISIFIDFLYTGIITISQENVCDLEKLANHIKVPEVQEYCNKFRVEFSLPKDEVSENLENVDKTDRSSSKQMAGNKVCEGHLKSENEEKGSVSIKVEPSEEMNVNEKGSSTSNGMTPVERDPELNISSGIREQVQWCSSSQLDKKELVEWNRGSVESNSREPVEWDSINVQSDSRESVKWSIIDVTSGDSVLNLGQKLSAKESAGFQNIEKTVESEEKDPTWDPALQIDESASSSESDGSNAYTSKKKRRGRPRNKRLEMTGFEPEYFGDQDVTSRKSEKLGLVERHRGLKVKLKRGRLREKLIKQGITRKRINRNDLRVRNALVKHVKKGDVENKESPSEEGSVIEKGVSEKFCTLKKLLANPAQITVTNSSKTVGHTDSVDSSELKGGNPTGKTGRRKCCKTKDEVKINHSINKKRHYLQRNLGKQNRNSTDYKKSRSSSNIGNNCQKSSVFRNTNCMPASIGMVPAFVGMSSAPHAISSVEMMGNPEVDSLLSFTLGLSSSIGMNPLMDDVDNDNSSVKIASSKLNPVFPSEEIGSGNVKTADSGLKVNPVLSDTENHTDVEPDKFSTFEGKMLDIVEIKEERFRDEVLSCTNDWKEEIEPGSSSGDLKFVESEYLSEMQGLCAIQTLKDSATAKGDSNSLEFERSMGEKFEIELRQEGSGCFEEGSELDSFVLKQETAGMETEQTCHLPQYNKYENNKEHLLDNICKTESAAIYDGLDSEELWQTSFTNGF